MGQAAAAADLQRAREGLESLSEIGGISSIRALAYLRGLDRVKVYTDSVHPGAPQGDLATFVIAETVRDSLTAPRIAAELFAAVPAGWPTSPYAPKALLALAVLRSGVGGFDPRRPGDPATPAVPTSRSSPAR